MNPLNFIAGLATALICAILASMALCLAGCATVPSPAAKAQQQAIADKAAVDSDRAKAEAQAKEDQAKKDLASGKDAAAQATTRPTSHPMTVINVAVAKTETVLWPVMIVSGLLAGVSAGLFFIKSLSWLSKIIFPIACTVAVLSFVGILSLPFLPWALAISLLTLAGLFIYEWVRLGTPAKALGAVEGDLGFTASTAASAAVLTSTTNVATTPSALIPASSASAHASG